MTQAIEKLLKNPLFHFTHSQKILIRTMIPEICLKENMDPEKFFSEGDLSSLLREDLDPVQKGRKLFTAIRKRRYPFSGGRNENFSATSISSRGVASLNSRKNLINPYFYGEGIFDLGEYVVSLLRSCPLDCAYCFLREIYEDPRFKVAPDYEKMGREVFELRNKISGPVYLNAGQNADSMILDAEFGLAEKLLRISVNHREVYLELRTKTDKIQSLLRLPSSLRERLIIAFSLNPEDDRKVFESNTAAIQDRCKAIQELAKAGFNIGLRFEPILYTKDLARKYHRLFSRIFSEADPERIHSISLGCLRLTKGLVRMLRHSHPRVLAEEWVLCQDNKYRYYRGVRVEIYGMLLDLLKPAFSEEKIVLSAEPPEVWRETELKLKTMPQLFKPLLL